VKVDGRESGESPVVLDVPAGRHLVRMERVGYKPVEQEVRVLAGQSTVVRGELVP